MNPYESTDLNEEVIEDLNLELWNPGAIANWSILLTPIIGAYLVSENWKALGQQEAAKKSKLWFIVYPLIVLALFFVEALPNNTLIFVLLIWYLSDAKKQIDYVKAEKIEYKKRKWYWPLVSGLILNAFILVIGIGVNALYEANQYGDKVSYSKSELYYKKPVTELMAKEYMERLRKLKMIDGSAVSYQVLKENEIFLFRMISDPKRAFKDFPESLYTETAVQLSLVVFDKKAVKLQLCDGHFKPWKDFLPTAKQTKAYNIKTSFLLYFNGLLKELDKEETKAIDAYNVALERAEVDAEFVKDLTQKVIPLFEGLLKNIQATKAMLSLDEIKRLNDCYSKFVENRISTLQGMVKNIENDGDADEFSKFQDSFAQVKSLRESWDQELAKINKEYGLKLTLN